jgi:hypothetical protein
MRQPPSKIAPCSMMSAGVWMLPRTCALRPNSMRSVATMSPLTTPLTFAVATVMLASTRPPALTMSVPFSELTRPVRCPSTRSIPLKSASPLSTVVPPTNPLMMPSRMSRARASDSDRARDGVDEEVVCVCAGVAGAGVC